MGRGCVHVPVCISNSYDTLTDFGESLSLALSNYKVFFFLQNVWLKKANFKILTCLFHI